MIRTGERCALHRDAVRVLTGWTPPDTEQAGLRDHFLCHLATHPDGLWRERLPEHLTASALVVGDDNARVLLHLHARLGRWLQFGGHCEPADRFLAAAARRETVEESGLSRLDLDDVPVQLSRHPVRCGGVSAYHLDVRYLAVAPAEALPVRSAESADLRWFAPRSLPDGADPSVVSLVERCLARRSPVPR